MEYVELNDVFFNKNTVARLDDHAKEIVEKIDDHAKEIVEKLDDHAKEIVEKLDDAKLAGKYKIKSKFNGVRLDVNCLSTGCRPF
jgi:spore cortex formation protein SpoVR/YcgB (stage V sporulation)